MPTETPEPARLPHPVRDGLGFFAAAFTALVRTFLPAPKVVEAEMDEEEAEAEEAPPHTGLEKVIAKATPYPIHD